MKQYPILPKEKLAKMPWNRLKPIMAQVRAVINSIDRYYGTTFDGVCVIVSNVKKIIGRSIH